MSPARGYTSEPSVAPGGSIGLCVDAPRDFELSVVRLRGPARQERALAECVRSEVEGKYRAVRQRTTVGSRVVARAAGVFRETALVVQTWLCPTLLGGRRAVLQLIAPDGRPVVALVLAEGAVSLEWGDLRLASVTSLAVGEWYCVGAFVDARTGQAGLSVHPRSTWLGWSEVVEGRAQVGATERKVEWDAIVLGGPTGDVTDGSKAFDGKLDGPRGWRLPEAGDDEARIRTWARDAQPHPDAVLFDLALFRYPSSSHPEDVSAQRLNVEVINYPLPGVTGHNWARREVDYRLAPDEYGALQFYSDHVDEANWHETIRLTIPEAWPSGIYAFRLMDDEADTDLPFVVTAKPDRRSDVVLLLPTFTYLAYGNTHVDPNQVADVRRLMGDDRTVVLSPEEHSARCCTDHGLSLYDTHADGSPCRTASRLRPLAEYRPGYRYWITGAPRHFAADLFLVGLLERNGVAYDVITDDDLDEDGRGAISGYKVVLTGSHPEYATERMLDAIDRHITEGGRLMYLGGNGFYWVTGVDGEARHRIEVRRGHAGTRTSDDPRGEETLVSTKHRGGLWRDRGRPPQRTVGVGMGSQGWCEAASFEIVPDLPWVAEFVFEGVDLCGPVGEHGPMGGAAGDELDRLDFRQGTPQSVVLLASSRGRHSDSYLPLVDDCLVLLPFERGASNPAIGADMVLLCHPNGGAVFSVGSIAWCSTLLDDPATARITLNVLQRFRRSAPVAENPPGSVGMTRRGPDE